MASQDIQTRGKLNQLLRNWPHGTVGVQSWLAERGVSRTLAEAYRKSGWLERIGRGAYVQAGDSPNWLGAVFSLQRHLHLTAHPAAKTALELKGRAHFLSLGRGAAVWLFADSGEKLPAWFRQRKWDVKVRFTTTNLFPATLNLGFTQHDAGGYEVNISAPERAAMELLHLVPQEQSYEEAKLLLEGLTTLRPKLVQELLQQCSSVKVKRLFMFLAEACNHAWVKKLDLSKVDFGKGKRMIVKGGRFDAKYGITVPQPYVNLSVTQKAGMYAMAQTGDLPMAAGENADQYPAMTKAQGAAFKARWARVEAAELDELRTTSIDQKLRQLAALMASVAKLGWNEALAAEEIQAREQWQRLRQAYGV